jgi:hypothetical protein
MDVSLDISVDISIDLPWCFVVHVSVDIECSDEFRGQTAEFSKVHADILRDGAEFCGWWFGDELGDSRVWTHCSSHSNVPPPAGWKIHWDAPKAEPDLLTVNPYKTKPGTFHALYMHMWVEHGCGITNSRTQLASCRKMSRDLARHRDSWFGIRSVGSV